MIYFPYDVFISPSYNQPQKNGGLLLRSQDDKSFHLPLQGLEKYFFNDCPFLLERAVWLSRVFAEFAKDFYREDPSIICSKLFPHLLASHVSHLRRKVSNSFAKYEAISHCHSACVFDV